VARYRFSNTSLCLFILPSLQPSLPDPEPDPAAGGEITIQLLELGTKLVLEAAGLDEFSSASRLVADRVLPALYSDRYDEEFLRAFCLSIELTRDALSRESPHLPDTLSELAGHAIFRQARGAIQTRGRGCLDLASQVDPRLPDQLERDPQGLRRELERLYETAFEHTDVLVLFRLENPDAIEHLKLAPEARERLRFENWQAAVGAHRRPDVSQTSRARPQRWA
jgi:hypothetical protein